MAFVDDYSPINFIDLPNETTPIDADNLNKMDEQIKKLTTFASTTDNLGLTVVNGKVNITYERNE